MTDFKIKVEDLHKSFGSHAVLQGINLNIEAGKSLVILGGSGTGKSVLIKTIIGLIKPTSGKVIINGEDLTSLNAKGRSELMAKCGFLFQAGALFDSLTIEENITFFAERLYNLTLAQRKDLAVEKLQAVGLSDRVLNLYPAELSGGMQKRASLARTICTNPEIIFFDEPTTGLDPIMANVINDLIVKIKEDLGATCVTITHDMNSAARVADKVAMIYEGKIIWEGSPLGMENCDNDIVKQFVTGSTIGPISVNN